MKNDFSLSKTLRTIARCVQAQDVEGMHQKYFTALTAIGSDFSLYADFETQVAPLLQRGYTLGLEHELALANQLLQRGAFLEGSRAIATAEIYAQQANEDWKTFVPMVDAMYAEYQKRFVFSKKV